MLLYRYMGTYPTEMTVAEFAQERKMPFYKMLKHDLEHHGFQYQAGLNVDVLEFNPTGICEPGGLYFSCEKILWFNDDYQLVAEVVIPEDAQVYETPYSPKKWKADKLILKEPRPFNSKAVMDLVAQGAKVYYEDVNTFVGMAIEECNLGLFKSDAFMRKMDGADKAYVIQISCNGDPDFLAELLSLEDFAFNKVLWDRSYSFGFVGTRAGEVLSAWERRW